MTQKRKIIVHIATSADGYIARPDAKLIGRKTFERSVEMGAHFSADDKHYVFSRKPPPASVPAGVEFVSQSIGAFAMRLREQPGKNIWMLGGGELIASFLDEDAIDEFIITVVPIFIGGRHSTHRAKASRGAAKTAFREALS